MENWTPEFLAEYEEFVSHHPLGGFMQSPQWARVKSDWGHEIVVSRSKEGKIVGSMMILTKKVPGLGVSLLYAPRGPVCDLHDRAVMEDLLAQTREVAKKYHGYRLTVDPYVLQDDQATIDALCSYGFSFTPGALDLRTIQTRHNYMLTDIAGKTEDEVFMSFSSKTRYNVRVALKHGVECRVCGPEAIDDFYPIMQVTGERDNFNTRPKSYFVKMLNELGEHCRMYLCYYQGKAISGAITTQYAGKTCYVYGASDNQFRNVMPNYLMQWEMIRWALEAGCDTYDFQGIPFYYDENSPYFGIYRFKRGFNGKVVSFAGDFDLIYRPTADRLVSLALATKRKINDIRHHRSIG